MAEKLCVVCGSAFFTVGKRRKCPECRRPARLPIPSPERDRRPQTRNVAKCREYDKRRYQTNPERSLRNRRQFKQMQLAYYALHSVGIALEGPYLAGESKGSRLYRKRRAAYVALQELQLLPDELGGRDNG